MRERERERERASVSASVRNIKRELEREKEGGISSIYTWCPKDITTGHGNIRMTLSEKEREKEIYISILVFQKI